MVEIGAQARQFLGVAEVRCVRGLVMGAGEDGIDETVALVARLEIRAQGLRAVIILVRRVIGFEIGVLVDRDIRFLAVDLFGVARFHLLSRGAHLLFGGRILFGRLGVVVLLLFGVVLLVALDILAGDVRGRQVTDDRADGLAEGRLVVQLAGKPIERLAGAGLDLLAPDGGDALGAFRQCAAGEAFAQKEFEGRSEDRFGVFRAGAEIGGAAAEIERRVEIAGGALHGIGAEAFDTGRFGAFIDAAGKLALRAVLEMGGRIMMGAAQGHGVRLPPDAGGELGRDLDRWRTQHDPVAVIARVITEADLQFALGTHRLGGRGERGLEEILGGGVLGHR